MAYFKKRNDLHMNARETIKNLTGEARFEFKGSEKDIENHIIDNINEISISSGWGEVSRVEKQYRIGFKDRHYVIDIFVYHKDGTGTLIECKKNSSYSNCIGGIEQVLIYGEISNAKMGHMPRLVIASDTFSKESLLIIAKYKLPVCVLRVDGNRAVYGELFNRKMS